jgi:hypothetical protein
VWPSCHPTLWRLEKAWQATVAPPVLLAAALDEVRKVVEELLR